MRQAHVIHPTTIAGFINDAFGITAGPSGVVHYTIDGGETWPLANNTSMCRFGLDIVDEQVAWTCGNTGHVRVSTDGARNWQAVTGFGSWEPDHCRFLSFLDSTTGWAATPDQLAATRDGGVTWTAMTLPDGVQKIIAIALRTAADGYVLDSAGELLVTQDGGQTWSTRRLSPEVANGARPVSLSVPTAAVRFTDPDHGLVILSYEGGEAGGHQVLALHTADAGRTWSHGIVPGFGALFLAHDGVTLTITSSTGREITVLRYQER